MDKKQIFQVIQAKTGMKKWVIIVIIIAVGVGFISWGGNAVWNKGNDMYADHLDKIEKEKQAEIDEVNLKLIQTQDSIACVNEELALERITVQEMKDRIPQIYYRLNKIQDEKKQLLLLFDAIRSGEYTQRELDSFAEHVRYQFN
tara:strand:+ start:9193 stop:9627 length:435 start_codon:yes stop_codon:yes gene_type:complete